MEIFVEICFCLTVRLLQVEAQAQVRKELPTPEVGALRPPADAASLHSESPSSIEDLNVLLPDNVPRFATASLPEQVLPPAHGSSISCLAFWCASLGCPFAQVSGCYHHQ